MQSIERQLAAITQKLEAIHADVQQRNSETKPASPRTNKANDFPPSSKSSSEANSNQASPKTNGRTPQPPGDEVVFTVGAGRRGGGGGGGAPIAIVTTDSEMGSSSLRDDAPVLTPAPPAGGKTGGVSPGRQASGVISPRNQRGGLVIFESLDHEKGGSVRPGGSIFTPEQSPGNASLEKQDKKKSAADRQVRKDFLGPLECDLAWHLIPKATGVSCVWLGCAALAIEFVSKERTSMEQIMTVCHMALHYVSFPSVTLAELYDTVEEYVAGTPLRSKGVKVEVATFDSITVDDVGDEIGGGERLPVMTLAAFRKELSRIDPQSMLIFNYDPYVVQEAEIIRRADDDDDDEEAGGVAKKPDPVQWGAKNMGQFAILMSFNSALHTVTIGTPHLGPDNKFRLEMHTASVQTMYAACCVKDGYTNKSRGFVRVFADRMGDTQVPSIFPVSVLDGRDAGGLLSIALDVAIAPHILGLSMLHHLVQSTLLSEKARRRQSTKSVSDIQLRGIPVTKLCHVLDLPVTTIVGGSTKESVSCAFAWYKLFLEKLGIDKDVPLGVVPITRRGGAEDGAVNISDEQFLRDVSLAISTKSVMLIGFNVNVALNVVVDARPDPCHYAIVAGIDEAHGIVRLADVNVKKYRKLWHVPITRLYNAATGYGYLVAAKTRDTIEQFNCQKYVDSILSQGRYQLPPQSPFSRFEHPPKNYTITVLADAVDRLGFPNSTVESFVHNSGFHVSFLLSEHIPLQGAARIASFYSHTELDDEVKVTVTHYDDKSVQTVAVLEQAIQAAVARQDAFLLVNFQPLTIQKDKAVWNGGAGGPLAIVVRYDASKQVVTLSDANASAYYRTWKCPLALLYEAVAQVDRISSRARGTLLLEKARQTLYDDTKGYDMRRAMVHHPFKPTVSSAASAMALAASEMLQKSFSQEEFIYNALEYQHCSYTTRGADIAAVLADTNHALKVLKLPLVAKEIRYEGSLDTFKECLRGVEGMLSVVVVLYDVEKMHSLKGAAPGAAVVNNRGEDGLVKLIDANPTVVGDFWETSVHALFEALRGVAVIQSDTAEELDS